MNPDMRVASECPDYPHNRIRVRLEEIGADSITDITKNVRSLRVVYANLGDMADRESKTLCRVVKSLVHIAFYCSVLVRSSPLHVGGRYVP